MGTIVWTGPFTIPALSEFQVEFRATMPEVDAPVELENKAWGQLDEGEVVGPASAKVEITPGGQTVVFLPAVLQRWAPAAFTVTKTANPTQTVAKDPGALITYTVTLKNQGTVKAGVLADIRDTLPSGFTFVKMVAGSGVAANPTGTTGQIVWNGPFTVQPESSLTLIYQARASTQPGIYVNQATATTTVGSPPKAPAQATVELRSSFLFEDAFDHDADQWTQFVNGRHLSYYQWYWEANVGRSGGAYNHARHRDPNEEAEDALTMYLGTGSEQWTNYRYETWVWFSPSSLDSTTVALWFRGHYQEDEDWNQWVLGYYLNVAPRKNRVSFWQNQTPADCIEDTCTHEEWQYNFENPMELARQRYDMDVGWLGKWHKIAVEVWGDEDEGAHMEGYVDDKLVIEFTDAAGTVIPNGSVGLGVYRASLIRFDDVKVTPLG
jgi:uncharacterized repeat protein (TIGR01451 family)